MIKSHVWQAELVFKGWACLIFVNPGGMLMEIRRLGPVTGTIVSFRGKGNCYNANVTSNSSSCTRVCVSGISSSSSSSIAVVEKV